MILSPIASFQKVKWLPSRVVIQCADQNSCRDVKMVMFKKRSVRVHQDQASRCEPFSPGA
jgi:hypothetical protein